MFPKAGDIVDINPLFKEAYRNYYNSLCNCDPYKNIYGENEDGHVHVVGVKNYKTYYVVNLDSDSSYTINPIGGTDRSYERLFPFGWSRDAQLFVPTGMKKKDSILDLKSLNTQPDSTNCAGCNGLLKDPRMGPRFKYCPKCEP
jgi:hypothetical protein